MMSNLLGRVLALAIIFIAIGFVGSAAQEEPCLPAISSSCSFFAHKATIGAMAYSPDGRYLATASSDMSVVLWDAVTGTKLRTLTGHRGEVWAVAFSPDGKLLATGSHDKTIKIWEIPTGNELMTLSGHLDFARSVRFSPDGSTLASGSWDHSIRLWRVSTGRMMRMLVGHTDWVVSVDFSPDGRRLVSGSDDFSVRVWDIENGGLVHKLEGHTGNVWAVRYSPDGRYIASAAEDETVRIWDAQSGVLIHELTGHTDAIRAMEYNSAGDMIATASRDGSVRLWDPQAGVEIASYENDAADVWSVIFSPDDDFVIFGGCTSRNTAICREGEVSFQAIPGSRSISALDLAGFDANQNNAIEDGEFFTIVDAWISGSLTNELFFDAVDIWISSTSISAALSAQVAGGPQRSSPFSLNQHGEYLSIQTRHNNVRSIELELFDLEGKRLINQSMTSAQGRLVLKDAEGRALANGVYLTYITTRNPFGVVTRELKKLVLLR